MAMALFTHRTADTLEAEMLASLQRQQQEELDNSPAASPRRGPSHRIVQQIKESNKKVDFVNDPTREDGCNSKSND